MHFFEQLFLLIDFLIHFLPLLFIFVVFIVSWIVYICIKKPFYKSIYGKVISLLFLGTLIWNIVYFGGEDHGGSYQLVKLKPGEAVYVKIKKPYLDLIKGSGVSVLKFKDKTDGKIRIYDSYLREQIGENEYIYDAEKKSVHYYNEKEGEITIPNEQALSDLGVEFNENYSIDVNFTQNRAFVFSVSDSDQDITVQNESDKPISFYVKAYHRVYGSEGRDRDLE